MYGFIYDLIAMNSNTLNFRNFVVNFDIFSNKIDYKTKFVLLCYILRTMFKKNICILWKYLYIFLSLQ